MPCRACPSPDLEVRETLRRRTTVFPGFQPGQVVEWDAFQHGEKQKLCRAADVDAHALNRRLVPNLGMHREECSAPDPIGTGQQHVLRTWPRGRLLRRDSEIPALLAATAARGRRVISSERPSKARSLQSERRRLPKPYDLVPAEGLAQRLAKLPGASP
jgi:hypothetical protein